MTLASETHSSPVNRVVKSHVAEVSVLPLQGVLVWPRMCCCCLGTTDLDSIVIYSRGAVRSFGPNKRATVDIPYCRRCKSHHRRAGVRAFESGAKVLGVGIAILVVPLSFGMLFDPFVGLFLQLLVVAGSVGWGVRSYFVARAEIKNGITPACSAAETAAVLFVTARPGWRFRFVSQAYAEQFASANRGTITPWY